LLLSRDRDRPPQFFDPVGETDGESVRMDAYGLTRFNENAVRSVCKSLNTSRIAQQQYSLRDVVVHGRGAQWDERAPVR